MDNADNENNTASWHANLKVLFIVLGCAAVVWAIYWCSILLWTPATDASAHMAARGQFGDMFGALTCLFTAFAFAGVIATILLQREELSLQRKELQYTRAELRRSAEAQEKSERALAEQAYSLLIAARLNALKARIDIYDV